MPAKTSVSPGARFSRPVLAGGAVVSREDPIRGTEVVLIHRKRYNDWSLPKGKLEAGESIPVCAVREVLEETGVTIRLGVPLDQITYEAGKAGLKQVSWWGGVMLSSVPRPGDAEVDDVCWLPIRTAMTKLTYSQDHFLVRQFLDQPRDDTVDHRPAREGDGSQGLVAQGYGPADQRPRAAAGEAADPDAVGVRRSAVDQFHLDPVLEHGAALRRGREDPRRVVRPIDRGGR